MMSFRRLSAKTLALSVLVLLGLASVLLATLSREGGVGVPAKAPSTVAPGKRVVSPTAPVHVQRLCTPLSQTVATACELDGVEQPENANVTALIVSVTLVNKVAGPAVAIVVACPLWRFAGRTKTTQSDRYVAPTLMLRLSGTLHALSALGTGATQKASQQWTLVSFAAAEELVDWERLFEHNGNYGSASLLAPIPIETLAHPAWAYADRIETVLTVSVSAVMALGPAPLTNTTYVQQSRFEALPVGLPLGVGSPKSWAQLALGVSGSSSHAPKLQICYSPVWSYGKDATYFFDYIIDLIEYHRHIGAHHIVFYFAFPEESVQSHVDNVVRRFHGEAELVTLTFVSELDKAVDGYYHNQRALIADCVHQQSGAFSFLWVADIDEWLWVTHPGTVVADLHQLWARRTGTDVSMFAFTVDEDHVSLGHCCERQHPAETLDDATARLRRPPDMSTPRLTRLPYFATGFTAAQAGDARIKTLSLTGYIRSASTHYAVGGELNGQSVGQVLGGTVLKLHTRGLPFEPPTCRAWGTDCLAQPFVDDWTHQVYPAVRTLRLCNMTQFI